MTAALGETVMAEATKRIPDVFRAAHPEIRWRGMAALRDVLIHRYDTVDLKRVWAVVDAELPRVATGIRAIVPPLDDLEQELSGESD